MELHHLKIFAFVYKYRSFTKASLQLHISQPTISEHIKNFEKILGCKLFDRMGRSIIPTSEANLLYPRALKILDDIDRLQEDLTATDNRITGKITIGASTIPGTYLLPSLVVGFKKRHPDTVFEMRIEDTAKITDLVLNHNLICGVVGAFSGHQKLAYQPLLEDELILVAAPGMISKNLKTPDRLYTIPFLIREPGSGTRKIMEIFLEQAGIDTSRLQVVATVGTTAAIKEALKAGLGAAILSRLAVKEELDAGKLQEVKVANLVIKRDFYIIRHTKRSLPLQYQTFIEYIRQNIKPLALS